MSLNHVLTESEVSALKQSIMEDLNIGLHLNEAKAKDFWRTVRGQKIQFRGIPDDGKPDTIIKGGSRQIRMALQGQAKALKKLTDKVKNARSTYKNAKKSIGNKLSRLGKAGRDAKKAALTALDSMAAMSGVI